MLRKKSFKLFNFTDVFEFKRGERLVEADQIEGDMPFISSTRKNNGIDNYISPPDHMTVYENKMTLSNSGSVGYLFYHPYKFVASDHITVIWIKDTNISLNLEIALFLKPIFESIRYKYNFGREISNKRLINEQILLPITEGNEPDWDYMNEFISLCYQKIEFNKLNIIPYKNKNLDVSKWKEFNLKSDLFKISRGDRLTKENRLKGSIPLVTAGFQNQGISDYISNDEMRIYNNCITIDMFGNCFYRDYEFFCDDNIIVLEPNFELNTKRALFLITLISLDKYKYSYGRQYRLKHNRYHKILLPVDLRGEVDWSFIAEMMDKLPYIKKIL